MGMLSVPSHLPVDYKIMSWSIVLLEIFEVVAILVIFFLLWKLWKFIYPFKRLIGLLKDWDDLLTKHEMNKAKKEKLITDLRKEIRKLKTAK